MSNKQSNTNNAHHKLQRQSQLLHALNEMATILTVITPAEFAVKIKEALQAIGTAAGAGRVFIWRDAGADDHAYFRKVSEWTDDDMPTQDEGFAQATLSERVKTGIVFYNGLVRDLPEHERAYLEADGIASFMIVPLNLNGALQGFIGFDFRREERLFEEGEALILQAAGSLASAAIIQNDMTKRLMDARNELAAHEKLLRAVNDVAALLIREEEDGVDSKPNDDFILKSLQLLAESVDADRGFLWRNSTIEGVLCSTELCEWSKGARSWTPNDQTPVDIPLDGFLPEWRDTLMVGRNLNMLVRDMGPEFRNSPAGKGVLVTMNVPLVVHGNFWGLIGFDNMHDERLWTETEMDILQSAGMLIASAIMRKEMVTSLVEAKETALASTIAKSEFLSRMSHEIRTPLNAVIGMATLAHNTNDLDRIKYCLDKIDGSSRQLLSIINDVLDMSKIESGKFEIYVHPFDFEKMLQHAINVVQVKLEEKHQELILEMDQFFAKNMVGDELRLSQVLINLLTNAIKFTPDFGAITLRIIEQPQDDGHSILHVEVADTGIGISKEQQSHLFTSFSQADGSISRQYGGSGLGLAICKKITNLMDGDIWVESESGHGSTFIFEVRVGWGEQLEKIAYSLRDNLRILVVDDSRDVLEYFDSVLQGFGIKYDTADSGLKAVELATTAMRGDRPYDLAFIDWGMPGLDGCQTAKAILEVCGNRTKIVIISVADHSDIQTNMRSAGVEHFLAKPVLPSVLYNTILQLTEHALAITKKTGTITKNWRGKKILLAEDIEINREILASLLENTGIAIDYAFNGEEAVEMCRKANGAYDLVLMDVQMPVMDGLSATRAIRASETIKKSATLPIIAMTANAFKEDIQSCLDAGMNDHIAKPIEVDQLMEKLSKYLDA